MIKLNTLLDKKSDSVTKAKVVSKVSATRCIVIDKKGRKFTVESDGSYGIGQHVQIKSNVIISKTKANPSSSHFIV